MIKADRCPYAAGQNGAGKDANMAKDCMRLKRRITPRRTVDEGKDLRSRVGSVMKYARLNMISAARADSDKHISGSQRRIYCASRNIAD